MTQPISRPCSFLPRVENLEDRITPDASSIDPTHFQQLSAQEHQYHQILQALPGLIDSHFQQFADWINATRAQLQTDILNIETRISQLPPAEQQLANAFVAQAVNEISQEQSLEQAEQKIVAAAIVQLQQFQAQVVALDVQVAQQELVAAVSFLQQQKATTDPQVIAFFQHLIQQASDDLNEATVDVNASGAAAS